MMFSFPAGHWMRNGRWGLYFFCFFFLRDNSPLVSPTPDVVVGRVVSSTPLQPTHFPVDFMARNKGCACATALFTRARSSNSRKSRL